jgi:tripartite ATP-independent transporter DctP family solute receptor
MSSASSNDGADGDCRSGHRRQPGSVIVASGMDEARPEWLDDWKRWTSITAVARDNLFFVPPDLIQRHTPRLLDTAPNPAGLLCQHLETQIHMREVFQPPAACALSATPLGVLAQQPIVIKFSHVVAHDTPKGLAAEFFAKRAGELSKGKVKVEVYANSTLYKDKEEMEALQLGAVQMLAPSLAKFGPLGVKEFELFDLPYIFDNYTELHKVTQGPIGQSLLKKLEPKGVVGLAFWDNGFKSFSANTPIKTPADLKGKKLRIQSSKVLEEEIRALSALPQVMAFSEVYQALQTGVVDGTENPISNLYTQKMFEVQKHLALTEHGYLGMP